MTSRSVIIYSIRGNRNHYFLVPIMCQPLWFYLQFYCPHFIDEQREAQGCLSVTPLSLTLCDPRDCSPPGSSVHGILQARILEWVAIPFSRGSSWLRERTWVSCIAGKLLATSEVQLAQRQALNMQYDWNWNPILLNNPITVIECLYLLLWTMLSDRHYSNRLLMWMQKVSLNTVVA